MKIEIIYKYAAALLIALLCSCSGGGSDEPQPTEPTEPEQVIPTEGEAAFAYHYFTATDGDYHTGAISNDSSLAPLSSIECSSYAITGGVIFLSFESSADLTHIAVGLSGSDVDGYYTIPARVEESGVAGVLKYSVELLVSGYISTALELQFAGANGDQITTQSATQNTPLCRLNDSALRISLSFTGNKDLDLHVILPDGREIYYGDSGDFTLSGTQLFGQDITANNGCVIDQYRCESIYITEEYLQQGDYEVYVNLYGNCDPFSESLYTVRAIQNNVDLKTPYLGSFDNTDDQNRDPQNYILVHKFTL
ncbi:MAG: hypothetical protein SNJ09_04250 [Rikenellaceae bacterium]